MRLKSLGELGYLKKKLVDEKAIGPLEERIQGYLEKEGVDKFEEISAREIALEIDKRRYGNLDKVYGCFSITPLEDSRKGVVFYARSFEYHLDENKFPLNASLGLILICSDIYRIVKFREKHFCERLEREFKRREEEINNLNDKIDGLENTVKGKIYLALENIKERNRIAAYLADVVKNHFLFRDFAEEYDRIKKQKEPIEKNQAERRSVFEKTLDNHFYPFRLELAYILGNVIRKISSTEFGPFKDVRIMRLLRKSSVEHIRDVLKINRNPELVSYLKSDIYRYTLLLNDEDHEKLSLLEEGLEYTRESIKLDEVNNFNNFKLGSYLQDLFIARYVQQNDLDFELLKEFYDVYRSNIDGFQQDMHKHKNVQLMMHIFNSQFTKLDAFFNNVLNINGQGDLVSYCSERDISFKRLYGEFSSLALKTVPQKYRNQYERRLEFKGI